MRYRVELVAEADVESEVRGDFPLVLRITLVKGSPVADHSLALQITGGRGLVVDEIVRAGITDRLGGDSIPRVIQAHAHHIGAELERVTSADHRQVVDVGEGRAHLGVQRVAGQTAERRRRNAGRHRRDAVAPVVVVGAIHAELGFIDGGWREDVLEGHDPVGRNVRHDVMRAQGIGRVVDVNVVDVVARI